MMSSKVASDGEVGRIAALKHNKFTLVAVQSTVDASSIPVDFLMNDLGQLIFGRLL